MSFELKRVVVGANRPFRPDRIYGQERFEQALDRGYFETTACKNCGKLEFPPVVTCSSCGSRHLAWQQVAPQGRLFSVTRVHAAPARFSNIAPYQLGLVDLDAGLRLLCFLLSSNDREPEIGEPIHLAVLSWVDGPLLGAISGEQTQDAVFPVNTVHGVSFTMVNAPFRALVCDQIDTQYRSEFRMLTLDDLPQGEVLIEVAHSALNYKDGLAVTGRAPICRSFPMVAGIDLAGQVVESQSPEFTPGQWVVVNGRGMSETRWGGYSRFQRVPADAPIPLPSRFSSLQAMQIGTAGFTAMLCVMALQSRGLKPADGAVVVTGASGGVGSVAISLLSRLGYSVVAVTGRQEEAPFLRRLGATDVVGREEINASNGPLAKPRWAGAIDVAGGTTLAKLIAQMRYGGVVAACGMAAGGDLPSTVYPFILRGIALIGVDSVMVARETRLEAWCRLEAELDLDLLAELSSVEPLSRIFELAPAILEGRTRGRIAIDVNA